MAQRHAARGAENGSTVLVATHPYHRLGTPFWDLKFFLEAA